MPRHRHIEGLEAAARSAAFGRCVHRGLRGLRHSTDALAARADPSTGQAPAWQARQQADRRGPTCAYPSWWPGGSRHHQFAERRRQLGEPTECRTRSRNSCGARTRSRNSCQAPAMPNGRCRMHGGMSPGAPKGNKNALKHGLYTAEAIARRRHISGLIRAMKSSVRNH
jgi:hypothetical protein